IPPSNEAELTVKQEEKNVIQQVADTFKTKRLVKQDGKGVLSGITLSEALDVALQFGASMKQIENYILEVHFPSSIENKALAWNKEDYINQIKKVSDLSEIKSTPKGIK